VSTNGSQPLLEVEGLHARYPVGRGIVGTVSRAPKLEVHAVDGVSFSLHRGEMLALVGESGCGKTSTAQSVLRLIETNGGSIRFDGTEISGLSPRELRPLRRRMQIVYQDPYESLDPRFGVGATIEEPLQVHGIGSKAERRARSNVPIPIASHKVSHDASSSSSPRPTIVLHASTDRSWPCSAKAAHAVS
jgi:ABC-type microcin C transport system duplicated ATPase subunit YejF